jgi:hypothetical protein
MLLQRRMLLLQRWMLLLQRRMLLLQWRMLHRNAGARAHHHSNPHTPADSASNSDSGLGPLAGGTFVYSSVPGEIGRLCERLSAQSAFERFGASVGSHVALERARLGKGFVALITRVRPEGDRTIQTVVAVRFLSVFVV